jgi:MFS family permease
MLPSEKTSDTGNETSWLAIAAVLLCGTAVAMNLGKVPVAMPELRREFGLSLVSAGTMSSMVNTLAVTSALVFGVTADRVGALRMCLIGLLVSALGTVGALFASGETGLLVSRFAEGAGLVSVAVSAPTLLTAASSLGDRRFVLSMWGTNVPAGVGLVMLISPLMMPLGGWRALWLLTAAAVGAGMLATGMCRRAFQQQQAPAEKAGVFENARQALSSPVPWLLGLAQTTWSLQHFALIVWLPTFLKDQRGFDPARVALLSCLVVLANVPGNLLGARLLHRGIRRGSLIAGGSLLAGLAGAGIYLDILPDEVRYALCIALSFIGGLIPASVFSSSVILARTPKQIATLQGLFMQLSNLGSFAGPPLIAMLVAAQGQWQYAYVATGTAAVAGIVLGMAIRRRSV